MAKQRPHILVDGYNLIKCVPLYSETQNQSLAAARDHIEAVLSAHAKRGDLRVSIYYDGDPEIGYADYQQRGNIDIFFSRRPQKADDLIMEAVERKHGARWLRVVTSDREIQRFAARHNIAFVDSPTFAEELERPVQRADRAEDVDPGSDPHWAPERNEVDELAKAFQQPTRRAQPKRNAAQRARELDPDLALDEREVDEWEQLFKQKSDSEQ